MIVSYTSVAAALVYMMAVTDTLKICEVNFVGVFYNRNVVFLSLFVSSYLLLLLDSALSVSI